ncbi:MAG: CD225/dispanin family protein [Fuerstia sp.]|nr:CD225/dispanin family protein [Fuerstiella sp.]
MSETFDPYFSEPQGDPQRSGHPNSEVRPAVRTHLVKAILSTCLCFVPLGIVAIVFAAQVNVRLEYGDHTGATRASKQANFYGNLSIWLGVLSYVSLLIMVVIAILARNTVKTE